MVTIEDELVYFGSGPTRVVQFQHLFACRAERHQSNYYSRSNAHSNKDFAIVTTVQNCNFRRQSRNENPATHSGHF